MTYERLTKYRAELGAINQARIDFADRIHIPEASDEFRKIIGSFKIGNLRNSVCDWHGSSITSLVSSARKDIELSNMEYRTVMREARQYKLESVGQILFTDEEIAKSVEERSRANFFIRSPGNSMPLW